MRIDADSNGSVEWHEFMNYMLLENQTLASMKQEHSEYVKSNKPDPAPHKVKLCHSDMITNIIVIPPEDTTNLSLEQQKRKMKFATSGRDGSVKIWNAHTMINEQCIQVTKEDASKKDPSKKIWVTCIHYMTLSKRLVAASANRMISFYDLQNTNYYIPTSRIEGLVGIPLCMEYYRWNKTNDSKLETLLVGDDLGICHMYNFLTNDWHVCEYKVGSQDPNPCHKDDIIKAYNEEVKKLFTANEEKKKNGRKKLNGGAGGDEVEKLNTKTLSKKDKPIPYRKHERGIKSMEKLIHKGWITKIKFYPDLNYIISSSLDGFIHIHDIDKLEYKDGKTFNLH